MKVTEVDLDASTRSKALLTEDEYIADLEEEQKVLRDVALHGIGGSARDSNGRLRHIPVSDMHEPPPPASWPPPDLHPSRARVCEHQDEPRGCYRVRCHLGRECVKRCDTTSQHEPSDRDDEADQAASAALWFLGAGALAAFFAGFFAYHLLRWAGVVS